MAFLSDGLEGRSRNPVSLLFDNLLHPDADLGANLQSKIKWRHDPSSRIDHLCLGRNGIGGVWNQLTSKRLQTVSMANWMELPNYSMTTFRQQCRARLATENQPIDIGQSRRATYDEVRSYYIHYVKRNRLSQNIRNHCEIISLERICLDASFDDHTPEFVWEVHGYDEQTGNGFVIHAKYVVLATGIPQEITRPLGIVNEQISQSFTYTTHRDIEELIVRKKQLTVNSQPLLVIGCGLTAIDVLLLCQQYFIPVLHVFRRALDDHELVLNQLSPTIYPEYDRLKEFMRQPSSSSWSYQCYQQSEILSISENRTVHLRNLRTQTITSYDISFVARLTGAEMKLPFFPLTNTKKSQGLPINSYTYECLGLENIYALGALAGDKLVRFIQGGAFACAADLLKKQRRYSGTIANV